MLELKTFEILANTALISHDNRCEHVISSLGNDVQKFIMSNDDLALREELSNKSVFTDSVSIVFKKDNHIS